MGGGGVSGLRLFPLPPYVFIFYIFVFFFFYFLFLFKVEVTLKQFFMVSVHHTSTMRFISHRSISLLKGSLRLVTRDIYARVIAGAWRPLTATLRAVFAFTLGNFGSSVVGSCRAASLEHFRSAHEPYAPLQPLFQCLFVFYVFFNFLVVFTFFQGWKSKFFVYFFM